MGEKFLEFRIPCIDCVVLASCRDKNLANLKTEDIEHFMLVMKKWDIESKSIRKALLESWMDLGFKMCHNSYHDESSVTEKKIFPVFFEFIKELSEMLEYISNSHSWRNGSEEQFDKKEIQNKIKRALSLL